MGIPRIHKYCLGVEHPEVGWDICDRCIRRRTMEDVPLFHPVYSEPPMDSQGRCVAFLGAYGSLADRWGTMDFFGNELTSETP